MACYKRPESGYKERPLASWDYAKAIVPVGSFNMASCKISSSEDGLSFSAYS
jgi:hypothetical protein